MKKSHLLGLALAGFLLSGCFHTPKSGTGVTSTTQQGTPTTQVPEATEAVTTNEEAMQEGATVRHTDSGFVPKTITVEVGTSVTFVNEGSGGMWVASAVHPTHQLLPGFDQLAATGTGTRYTYTFVTPGEWKYHNHVSPSETGVVVVE